MLLIIFGWGYQRERFEASLYLLFYTLFVSIPLIGGIFFIFLEVKSLYIYIYLKLNFKFIYLYLIIILAFLVKLPIVFFHI